MVWQDKKNTKSTYILWVPILSLWTTNNLTNFIKNKHIIGQLERVKMMSMEYDSAKYLVQEKDLVATKMKI